MAAVGQVRIDEVSAVLVTRGDVDEFFPSEDTSS